MLVLGDSHAASLGEAAIAAAHAHGLDAAIHWRSSCPFLRGVWPPERLDCPEIQERAWRLVRELEPEVVVLANHGGYYTNGLEHSWPARRPLIREGRDRHDSTAMLAMYGRGLDDAIGLLGELGVSVVLVDPAPVFEGLVVLRPSLLVPVPRARPLVFDSLHAQRGGVVGLHRTLAERHSHVVPIDPASALCDEGGCAIVDEGVYLYFDEHHLNARGNARLVPALEEAIGVAVGAGASR
ncbi:MAG: hypothetical protein EA398_18325 [Deltaproteobacteria bacterium]|nr:MAG: hypothetical protein EA398_18325 [Deltaproteobacteria bacterium]